MLKCQRVVGSLLIIALLIGGWPPVAGAAKEKPLYSKIKEIHHLIEAHQWKRAMDETEALKKLYRKEKWKLQLLGDEPEYEQIDQELEKLPVTLKDQDGTQAKMTLATIRALLHGIYSM